MGEFSWTVHADQGPNPVKAGSLFNFIMNQDDGDMTKIVIDYIIIVAILINITGLHSQLEQLVTSLGGLHSVLFKVFQISEYSVKW